MTDIHLEKVNNSYIRVHAENGIIQEIYEHFTFTPQSSKFSPLVRNKFWDGKIHLLNRLTRQIYLGCWENIKEFAAKNNYTFSTDFAEEGDGEQHISQEEIDNFFLSLNLTKTPRDYQYNAFVEAIKHPRKIFLSPTASGKSFIIFLILQWYAAKGKKVLVTSTRSQLVRQLASDFKSYTRNDIDVYVIQDTPDKSQHPITVATWQSIYPLKASWFHYFDVIIGDECHSYKAKSLIHIVTSCINADVKIGLTGTLDNENVNHQTLNGLFGKTHVVAEIMELVEKNHIARFKIKSVILKYREYIKTKEWDEELKYIAASQERNNFIMTLTSHLSTQQNTLILFHFVDHGKELYRLAKEAFPTRPIYLIHGKIKLSDRIKIKEEADLSLGNIIIASYGTFSEGVSVNKLHNLIMASPFKTPIRLLQSIGRMLRLDATKDYAVIFDIVDDAKKNITLRHYVQHRLERYMKEGFEVSEHVYHMNKVKTLL